MDSFYSLFLDWRGSVMVLIFDEFSSTIENSLLSFVIGRLLPIKKKSEVVVDNNVVTSVTGSFGRWGRASQELIVEDIQTLLEGLKRSSR